MATKKVDKAINTEDYKTSNDLEKAFKDLMAAHGRFIAATTELINAKDSLNKRIKTFKEKMPESFNLEMREF